MPSWPQGEDPDWLVSSDEGEADVTSTAESHGTTEKVDDVQGVDNADGDVERDGNVEVVEVDADGPADDDAAEPREPSVAAPRSRSSRMPTSMIGLMHMVLVSLTVTPSTTRFNVPLSLSAQLQNARALHTAVGNALQSASQQGIRLLRGTVARFILSIEAGKRRGKYHLQGAIVIETTERNVEMVIFALTQLMTATIAAVSLNLRITKQLKPVHFKDELYLVGYIQKDASLEHYADRVLGYDAETLESGSRVYRTKGGSTTYSSDKINQFPDKDRRAVGLNPANLLQVARWFMLKEGLRALLAVASLAVQTAWLLQTNNYVLETQIINGVKGAPLDEARLEALNLLNNNPAAREHVELVRCVLYGPEAMEMSPGSRRVQQFLGPVLGLPSSTECDALTLAQAKRLCKRIAPREPVVSPSETNATSTAESVGYAVVIDLISSAASVHAINLLTRAGFQVRQLLATNQCMNACGHIAEMAAVMLRAKGDCFHEITLEEIQAVNSYSCVMIQQGKLVRGAIELPDLLTDMQILHLATLDNPDNRGTEPSWLPGPGPLNSFEDALSTCISREDANNHVQIMVVNSVRTDVISTQFIGEHWFTVAWQRRSL